MVLLSAILVPMKIELAKRVVRTCGSCLAMILIWRLVVTALDAGIDGVLFFGGVAAIAGLGGYELRWIIDVVRSRSSANKEEK